MRMPRIFFSIAHAFLIAMTFVVSAINYVWRSIEPAFHNALPRLPQVAGDARHAMPLARIDNPAQTYRLRASPRHC